LRPASEFANSVIERVWKRCRTILASNAGKNTPEIGSPTGRWAGQIFRTLNLVQHRKILAEGRSPSLADHIAARRLERLDLDREFLVRGAHVGLYAPFGSRQCFGMYRALKSSHMRRKFCLRPTALFGVPYRYVARSTCSAIRAMDLRSPRSVTYDSRANAILSRLGRLKCLLTAKRARNPTADNAETG